jgi:hypothetical protein
VSNNFARLSFVAAGVLLAGFLGTSVSTAAGGSPASSANVPFATGAIVSPASAADGVWGTFTALGTGVNGNVYTLAASDDTLYAVGLFTAASGVADADKIAAWSSSTWHPLGTGMNGSTYALAVTDNTLADDTIYAGGAFTLASGVADTNYIAAWSDDTWHPLGTGMNGNVQVLAATDDTIYAGGAFTEASGDANTNKIAAWSDDTWHPLGTGMNNTVQVLVATDDTLYAGGDFGNISPFSGASGVANTRQIAAWSDDTWQPLGTGMNGSVYALAATDDTIYAGGAFTEASGDANIIRVAAWANNTWHPLGTGILGTVRALATDDTHGLLYAGGDFTTAGSVTANRVAVWDMGIDTWIPLQYATGQKGVGGPVRALKVDDSVVYLGGDFTNAGGDSNADRVARWTWDAPQGSNAVTGAVGDAVTITGEGFVGVPQTGGVLVGSIPATYTRNDSTSITFTVPAGVSGVQTLSVTGVGGSGTVGTFTAPTPPPPITYPPGAPTGIAGVAGDGQVSVSWTAPVSAGSFPVTTYAVSSTSGNQGCLTSAPAVTCVVSGLTNGTPYSFEVRALNGAGWGPWSAASDPVTPDAPVATSILITGSRGEMRGKPGVIVTGTSTGLGMGAIVRPMVKFPGQTSYAQGTASILVDEAGDFTWQRRTGKKTYVYVKTEDGTARSNRVIIPVG